VPESVANAIYDQMMDFAQYAFNKSHAAAYGVVAYRTAWLKCYYPIHFMAALLNSCLGNSGKVSQYIAYCRKHNMSILPPSVNHSDDRFTVEGNGIRFGLGAVRNVGIKAVQTVMEYRKDGQYASFTDFVERVPDEAINKRMVESMILSGCFDEMGYKRSALMAGFEQIMDGIIGQRRKNIAGQVSLFDALMGEEGTSVTEHFPDVPEYPLFEKLTHEKNMTGVYISGHPMMDYAEFLAPLRHSTLSIQESIEAGADLDGARVVLGGMMSALRTKATRAGALMAYCTLEDLYSTMEVLIFPQAYERYRSALVNDTPVLFYGRISQREDEEPSLVLEEAVRLTLGDAQCARLLEMDAREGQRQKRAYAQREEKAKKPAPAQKTEPKAPAAEEPKGEPQKRIRAEELPTYRPVTVERSMWIRMKTFQNEFLNLGILETLRRFPGSCAVKAVARDTGERRLISSNVDLTPELTAQLMEVLGEENVRIVEGKP